MSKFVFQLAGLLKIRERERDARRLELAEADRAAAAIRQQLHALDEEIAALRNRCREAAGPGPLDLGRLRDARRFETTLRSQAEALRAKLAQADERCQQCQHAVVEANREVKALEKLRDRQFQRHRSSIERREMAQIDEAAGRRGLSQFSFHRAPTEGWSGPVPLDPTGI